MWRNNSILYENIRKFNENYPFFYISDIFDVCKQMGINVIQYSNKDQELLEISKDGFTFYDNYKYNIFYNKDKPSKRIRFTIAHEIGHIFLSHHQYVKVNMLPHNPSKVQPIWERQANIFARNVLFPCDLAKVLKTYSHAEIGNKFGLSTQMIDVRYKTLKQDLRNFNYANNF